MNYNVGETYHSLKLLDCCGGGAYGEVFRAQDLTGRQLAVKIVSKTRIGAQWERELRGVINYQHITSDHPALLKIFHVEEDADSFFYTMELADALNDEGYSPDTLGARLRQGPVPAVQLFEVLSGIFAGIKAIHQAGFAHRDIKPDNILFVHGVPKLGDIGLLSALASELTTLAGTLEFIPPEARSAEHFNSSDCADRQRNDLYAFGKVVYCAATGQEPGSYPTIPPELPLSLPLKLFMQLAGNLCDPNSGTRLDNFAQLEQEFQRIERLLLHGVTWRDHLSDFGRAIWKIVRSCSCNSKRYFEHYWWTVLILLGVSGTAWQLARPKPFRDPGAAPTKLFVNKKLGVVMQVPRHWHWVSRATLRKRMSALKAQLEAQKEYTPQQIAVIIADAQESENTICCDYDSDFADNVNLLDGTEVVKRFQAMNTEEIALHFKQVYSGELGLDAEVYRVQYLPIAGKKCLVVELSINQKKLRGTLYYFMLGRRAVIFSLTTKIATYGVRQKELQDVFKTLKFKK